MLLRKPAVTFPVLLSGLLQLLLGSAIAQQSAPQQSTSQQSASQPPGLERSREEEIHLGSQTAKGGFQNEDEIRDKFNNWKVDSVARSWLETMKHNVSEIDQVEATKPHGEKADVEVRIKYRSGSERIEGISIKLVSNPQGFNQIDKRWLKTYVQKWQMPDNVHTALKLFVGESPPNQPSRDTRRMFLDELSETQQKAVVNFFSSQRQQIVSDLFAGDGKHAANWMMVTLKPSARVDNTKSATSSVIRAQDLDQQRVASTQTNEKPQWILRSTTDVAKYFGSGEVQITPAGSLKIGRITMQRKGGDNGRESANMLQFKINPAELLEQQQDDMHR